ncbi:hypothetical protein ACRAKI_17515 [Saccharothrix isguenensis]
MFVLAALPIVDPLSTDALTFVRVATPEYAKVLYAWVLAVVLSRYAIGFEVRPPKRTTEPGGGPWIMRVPVGVLRRLVGMARWLVETSTSAIRSCCSPSSPGSVWPGATTGRRSRSWWRRW